MKFNLLLTLVLSTMKGAIFTILIAVMVESNGSADNAEMLLEDFTREGNREVTLLTDIYVSRAVYLVLVQKYWARGGTSDRLTG